MDVECTEATRVEEGTSGEAEEEKPCDKQAELGKPIVNKIIHETGIVLR
ncbi:MAG: hypothetical protein JSW28_10005 [Thermoplasmata archaeon]|nr:MAG: hypothetical protein JSW28_10005 [Thermoplasmata archaeon]